MKKTTNQIVAIILYLIASLLAYYFYIWQVIPIIFIFLVANNLEKLEPESMTEEEWRTFLRELDKEDDKSKGHHNDMILPGEEYPDYSGADERPKN